MKSFLNKADELTRRDALKSLAAGVLGLNILQMSGRAAEKTGLNGGGKARSVIFVKAIGGISQVDSFDIKEANKEAMKGSAPIKTSADGIRVGKHFPLIAKQMHNIALINSMFNTQGAHGPAQYLMDTGYESRGTIIHPQFGAWVSKLAQNKRTILPSFIKSGAFRGSLGGGFFGSRYAALPVPTPSEGIKNIQLPKGSSQAQFEKQFSLLQEMNREFAAKVKHKQVKEYHQVYEEATKLMQSKDLDAFDISKESKATKDAYGNNSFGQSCLLARRLAETGVPFIEVSQSGWDHHGGLYEGFKEIAPLMDQAVGAMLADLEQRGLLKNTLVVFATEFGRSPKLSGNGGRNHHPLAYTCWLAGGGVKGGQAYGKTDAMGGKIVENKVKVADFNATIAYALGLNINHIEMTESGRPIQITDKGKPVTAIF